MMTLIRLSPLFFLLACSPTAEDDAGSSDAGTDADPMLTDADGDGYSDGEELDAGSDPDNGFDWPQGSGNWPDFSDEAAAAGVIGEGFGIGEEIPDILLTDQFDQPLSLYQYYGFVILLDVSAGWCNPCNAVAGHAEAVYQTHREDGFVLIHIMLDGWVEETPADMTFLTEWAQTHGLSFPLTSEVGQDGDPNFAVNQLRYAGTLVGGIPNFILIDRDMRIDFADAGYDDEGVLARVAELVSGSD